MGTNSPLRWATRMSPGPKTTASAPRSIRLGASVRTRPCLIPAGSFFEKLQPAATRSVSRNFRLRGPHQSHRQNRDSVAANPRRLPAQGSGHSSILPRIVRHSSVKTALSRNDVLCRPALNQTNVHRGVRWIEACSLILLQLVCDLFHASNQTGRPENRRGANLRISAVCFTAAPRHLGQASILYRRALVAVRSASPTMA